jgi:TonB family protein
MEINQSLYGPGLNFWSVQDVSDTSLWTSLKTNLRDSFFPAKLPSLHLTSRPLTRREMMNPVGTISLAGLQESNDHGLLVRLAAQIRDSLFPHKLPPLQLTSKPVKLRDMWGTYNYRQSASAVSAVVHVLMIGALLAIPLASFEKVTVAVKPLSREHVEMLLPADIVMPVSAKKDDSLAGGGGGGDRDKLQASKGRLPKFAMQQLAPPAVVLRNEHPRLAVEPSVVMPPDVKLQLAANMPNLGDPLSKLPSGPPSNGTGSGGGIGSGTGGGVGSGEGGGVGPGRGGGFGGGVFRVGNGVSAPSVLYSPDPEYTEEARQAKYQGICVLWLVVGPDGRPRDIKVTRSLEMGLAQKAVESVRQWKFEPAKKDGQPVAVQIIVQVAFKLY